MTHKCTNPQCPYGDWGLAGNAYDQDKVRWAEKRPNHNGLCLNCIDDDRRDHDSSTYRIPLDSCEHLAET